MKIQTKTHNRPEKGERFKVLQHQSTQRSKELINASAGSDHGKGDQLDSNGARAYAAQNATTPLGPFTIPRREVGAHDVQIDILYCGACHSDLHQVRNEWHNTVYPCVPGHEIVGRVVPKSLDQRTLGRTTTSVNHVASLCKTQKHPVSPE